MAKIIIQDLHVQALIGIYAHEKSSKQELIVTIEFEYDSTDAQKSDEFSEAVDYEEIANKVKNHIEKTEFNLLEKLASYLLNLIMEDQRIHFAKVHIDKPQALKVAKSVSLEIEKRITH